MRLTLLLPLWNDDQIPLLGQGWGHVLVVQMNHRTVFALWIEDTSVHWSLPFIFLEHFLKEMKNKEAIHFYLSLSYQTHILAYILHSCMHILLGHACTFANAWVLSCTYTECVSTLAHAYHLCFLISWTLSCINVDLQYGQRFLHSKERMPLLWILFLARCSSGLNSGWMVSIFLKMWGFETKKLVSVLNP